MSRLKMGCFDVYSSAAKRRWADPEYREKQEKRLRDLGRSQIPPERLQARAAGASRFFTGIPCARGHIAERYTAKGHCVVCKKEADRRQYEKNPEKRRQATAVWRKANPEWAKRLVAEWREKNLEYVRAYQRDDYKRTREKKRAYHHAWRSMFPDRVKKAVYARKHRLKEAGGDFSAQDVRDILIAQKGKCAYCKNKMGQSHTVDHIIPISKGGSNARRNIQLACKSCNSRKKDADPLVFARRQGWLL